MAAAMSHHHHFCASAQCSLSCQLSSCTACVPILCLLQQPVPQVPVACTTEQADIPGLYIIPEFVSEQEQQALLAHIDSQPWQHLAKRRVQHYGFKFEYSQRGVDMNHTAEHMPEWTQDIVQRLQVGSLGSLGLDPDLPDLHVCDVARIARLPLTPAGVSAAVVARALACCSRQVGGGTRSRRLGIRSRG